ncbi:MAG: Ig-like domain-containing protein, partial [Candidatus Acidiferrales bacterium]
MAAAINLTSPSPANLAVSRLDTTADLWAVDPAHLYPSAIGIPASVFPALLPPALPPAPPQAVQPPNSPTLLSPSNSSTGVPSPATLSVSASDPAGSNVSVTFYGRLAGTVGPNFTIVALPDTQYYSASLNGGNPSMFDSQTQWIVNNRVADNIDFVIGLGDIVQNGNNNGDYSEWINANAAANYLDDPIATGLPEGIPYSFGVGNHDEGPMGDGSPDDTAGYNQYFGTARYASKSYYGGHYGTDNDNQYELFSAGGMDFIVINIAYIDPQYNGTELNSVLAWANTLLQKYSNRRGIVVSHYLINNGLNASWSGQGQATYNALKGNPNLFLMLCGHYTPPEGQRTDTYNGNTVNTLLSDYQEQGNGGNGYMRIMQFSPANNLITVSTYSPYVNLIRSGSLGNFTLSYNMAASGYTNLGTVSNIASGSQASAVWNNLAPNTKYEWYAVVTNGTLTTTGPVWNFTTASSAVPAVNLSTASLPFGNQVVNTTSNAQNITLTNTGTATLSISSIAASSPYTETNTCGSSVAANGGTCTISVKFAPTTTGSFPGTITIRDNAAGSPQTVGLTGTGVVPAPVVSLSSTSLVFGNSAAAVVQDAATTGSGSSTLAVKFPSNVNKNDLLIVGASSYAGNAFASSAVTDTLGSTWSLAVTKNPGTSGTPSLAGIYYAIAPSAGADTITVHMTGTNNLHLHIYEVSGVVTASELDQVGSNYQTSTTAATVSTTAATTKANEFIFAYFARDNGVGTWTSGSGYGNALASPNTSASTDAFSEAKAVSTTGVQTATATSSASDGLTSVLAAFVASAGGTPVGSTSTAQTVTLTNTGTVALSLAGIAPSGDFSETNNCGTAVAVAGTCTISVTFRPTATGTRTGTITITDNAADSPQSVTLSGTGTPAPGPVAIVSPASLTFANQTVNTTSTAQTITLSNPGISALGITSIAPSAQYAQTNTCGASVAVGGNCLLTVTFKPTATGTVAGTITITDNAPDSPQTISLSGVGTPPTLVSIAVTPANPSIAKGLTQQFTATGTYSDASTKDLTSSVTWASSTTTTATISTAGLATALATGTTTIQATSATISGSTLLTVTPATLVSIAVTPVNPSLAKGLTQQFTATGTYTDNTTQNLTSTVTWSSSTTATATITTGGLATALATGTSTIQATSGAISGSTLLTVALPALVSIAVTPANPSIAKSVTQQFTATGTYSDNSTQDMTGTVTWSSGTTTTATITTAGLATGVAPGTSTIQAKSGTITGSTVLTVTTAPLVSIAVTPANPSIAKGATQQFTATGTYSDNTTQNITSSVTWTSGTATTAIITTGGLASALAIGTTTIQAVSGTFSGSTVLTVTPPTLVSIAVTPVNSTVLTAATLQYTATGTYSDNSTQNLTSLVTWSSTAPTVATISTAGLATGVAMGSTTILATSGAISGSTGLTVTVPVTLVSIAVTPANPTIYTGATQQFTATGTYSNNTTQNLTSSVTWSSSALAVATISTTGLATGVGPGGATIQAVFGAISGSTGLIVPSALPGLV